MIDTRRPEDIQKLRSLLDAHEYNATAIRQKLGSEIPPNRQQHRQAMFLTRQASAQNALLRLFFLGASIPKAQVADMLDEDLVETGITNGWLEKRDDRLVARIVIIPIDSLLFASDSYEKLGDSDATDFVLPASTHSATYLRNVTLKDRVKRTLDLGCGCGVHALFAAAISDEVVAVDISDAAIQFTAFNALLNGIDNVSCRRGDLFEPVQNEQFDRIVCNPPFVLSPDSQFVYRDNAMELDEFCRLILREAPAYLNEGGILQMLFESVEIDGEAWPDRMQAWAAGTGCDLWVLHNAPVHPARYVTQRLSDIDGPTDDGQNFEQWLAFLQQRRVTGIHPGVAFLRRREGQHWLHLHNLVGEVTSDSSGAVADGIRAQDFLHRHLDDNALLSTTLALSPHLLLEQVFGRDDSDWRPRNSVMKLGNGLEMLAEVDLPIVAFMNQLDGKIVLGDCLARFATAVKAELPSLQKDLLPVIRMFIGRGFIVPVSR